MMKKLKTTKLISAVGGAAVATLLSLPASAVTWQAGDWEASYTGFINLFATFSDTEVNQGDGNRSFTLNEGLLPSFHTMKVKSPTVGGLTGSSQITFAVDTNDPKGAFLNKDGNIDLREVFFNVEGSFGTISLGRGLSLYQRQAILKDMTLFGIGAGGGDNGGNGTSLGRIGYGYVYPDFNSRITWKLPTYNGLTVEFGIFQPDQPSDEIGSIDATDQFDTEMPQFQVEAAYNTEYNGVNLGFWVSGIYQTINSRDGGNFENDIDISGYNVGIDLGYGGFNLVASYYDGDAIGVLAGFSFETPLGCNTNQTTAIHTCTEAENDGYYVQGTYTVMGNTKIGISYGESTQDRDDEFSAIAIDGLENKVLTFGVYHDVTSWLKVIAEYNQGESTTENTNGILSTEDDTFSVGGFIFW